MNWLNEISDDIKYNLFRNIDGEAILFAALLAVVLAATFLSKKIAAKFKSDEEAIETLSVKIKIITLLAAAAIAVLVTRG